MKTGRPRVLSSLRWNKEPNMMGLPLFVWTNALVCAFVGMVLSRIIENTIFKPIGGVIFLVLAVAPVFLLLHLIGKNYDFENLERYLGEAKLKLKTRSFINLGRETSYKMRDGESSIHGLDGVEVIGFEVMLPEELEEDSIEIFLSRMEDLLRNCPVGFRIRYYRQSLGRPSLSEKERRLRENVSYITFDLFPSDFGYSNFNKFISTLSDSIFRRLSRNELMELPQRIVNPLRTPEPFTEHHPWHQSPVAIMRDKSLAHMGEIEDRCLMLSIAELPQWVGDEFQSIYDLLNRPVGTIAITFQTIANELFLPTAKKKLIEKLWKDSDVPKSDLQIDPSDAVRLQLHITAILHGSKEELKQLETDLINERARLPESERPQIVRDNAFMKEALLTSLPGMSARIPFRRQTILKKREAVRYLPLPFRKGSIDAPLSLRSESNSRYGWDVDTGHPTLVVAKVESGKSTLLQTVINKHVSKKGRVASFSMDVGGSFETLTEGVAEGFFSLERDTVSSALVSLPDHPLRIFCSFGEMGKSKAYEWLCDMLKIGPEKALLRDCVKGAISKAEHEEKYSLDQFYSYFKDAIDTVYAAEDRSEDHSANQALYRAAIYTRKDEIGKFFNPESPKDIDYTKVYHWYFRQKSAAEESAELAMPFFNFGLHLLTVLRSRFDPEGSDPRNFLITIDEIHFILGYIAGSYWILLNKQGRKQNCGILMATQNTADAKDKLGEYYGGFLASFSRVVFNHGISSMRDLAKALNKEDRVEFITNAYTACTKRIEEYRARGMYAWGFINEFAEFKIYLFDLDVHEVWEIDTRPTAKYMRKMVRQATGLNYFETCQQLAIHGPKKFHKSKLPEESLIDEIIRKVRYE